jgi:YidC/Oxa1 family membrane protein insertase
MERRVLIAVLLSFLVLYGYQAMFPPPPDPKPAQTTTSKAATAPKASGPTQSNPTASVQGAPAATAEAVSPEAVTPSAPAREIEIDNADVHAVFTTRGAVLKSWKLKKYRDDLQQPLEMIAGHAPADSPLPFTLAVDDPALSAKLAAAPFTLAPAAPSEHAGWQAQFDYQDEAGVRAQKIFTIAPDKPYVINVTASVWVNGNQVASTLRWGPALGSGVTVKSRTYNPPPQPIYFRDGKVARIAPGKVAEQPVQEGVFGFAGVDDHYFLVAVVKPNTPVRLDYAVVDVPLETHPEGAHYVSWAARFPSTPEAVAYFAGPKDLDVLAAVYRVIRCAIDFGMFSFLVVPLLRALKWPQPLRRQYGWSLILDGAHQPRDVPAPPQERGLDAENAGCAAGGEGHPGSLREAEDERSGARQDEHRADGALQGEGGQPRQRLRADAPDAAGALRVLLHALGRDRAPGRAVHRSDP